MFIYSGASTGSAVISVNIFFQPQGGTEAFTRYVIQLLESMQNFFLLKTDIEKHLIVRLINPTQSDGSYSSLTLCGVMP